MGKLEQLFGAASWSIPDDFLERSHFERIVKTRLDWTSSPGYPYMRTAPTNGDLFRVKNGVVDSGMLDFYWEVVKQQISERRSDPIRLFVKAEPIKLKKIELGRYRLISSVSVIDQIIDHMLFSEMNQAMIDDWLYVPPKIGWAPVNGGWRLMPKGGWMALDKTAWDWTVQPWLLQVVLDLRHKLCRNPTSRWWDLAQWRYVQLFASPIFITSGGMMLKQRHPGIMKSGCVNTIADNSIMQVILHLRVSLEMDVTPGKIYTMGDDTLQEDVPRLDEYMERMSRYSIVKQVVHNTEFAGNRFRGRVVEPLYRGKHAFTLLHLNPKYITELADSYTLLYHRSKFLPIIEDLFTRMGVKFLQREYRDAIFDGI